MGALGTRIERGIAIGPAPARWGPAVARQLLTGLGFAAAAALCRLAAERFVPALLPFVFTVPAVVGATLAGGGLAGTVALVGLQALTADFVLPHWTRDHGGQPSATANLLLATAGVALTVWATAAYRAAERRLRGRCEAENRTLLLFADEVDHRTRNNFQLAAALLHAQGAGAAPEVRDAFELAASRLVAIAGVYGRLSHGRGGEDEVPLLDHVRGLVAELGAAMFGSGVAVAVTGEEVAVPAGVALTVGLVLNEWLTNAAKYAFPDARGTVAVAVRRRDGAVELEVRDDGVGVADAHAAGTGSRLLRGLAAAHGGVLERRRDGGTLCRLRIPLP